MTKKRELVECDYCEKPIKGKKVTSICGTFCSQECAKEFEAEADTEAAYDDELYGESMMSE